MEDINDFSFYSQKPLSSELVDIRDNYSLVEVLSDYIPDLKMRQETYIGTCPFENCDSKKTLKVNTRKKVFYCTRCGAGGDVLHFMARIENLSLKEAAEELERKY